jgi:DNA modification methylase
MKLFNGDCLEIMPTLQSQSVDLIIADLPYGTTECSWDSIIPFEPMWQCINHVARPDTAILLFAQAPFDKVLACSNLKDFRHEWIWEKPNATGFFNAKKMPMKAHENILVFYKSLPTYNPQKTMGHKRASARKVGTQRQSECYGKDIKITEYDSTERYPRSVIKFSSDKQISNYHPTQKPLALIEYFVRTYSNPNDTVLDFCMGSGTTGVAAQRLGRNFVGIEKEQKYFETAKNRIENDVFNIDLFESAV